MGRKIVTMSAGLTGNRTLAGLLGQAPMFYRASRIEGADLVIGWGYRPSGRRALAASKKAGEVALLEDGFLRSVGRRDAALSINFDGAGIYYDPASPSVLFDQIRRPLELSEIERARALIKRWATGGLSKYNDQPERSKALPDRFALVIDQVRNDHSISSGLADEASFATMLVEALASDLSRDVVLKIHPDSLADPSKRHFDIAALGANERVHVVAEPVHVAELIRRSEAVYTVTSQVGFEALLHGKDVHVFGMPFYAGWGLTLDRLDRPDNRADVQIEQLVHAALIDYPRYWNPISERECEVEDAMALVELNRHLRGSLPSAIHALGFSRWKRPFVADFLAGSIIEFARRPSDLPPTPDLLLWGNRPVPDSCRPRQVFRLEDGFLRSSGLGANLVRPLSLVIDDQGIYYDASRPSRLEKILATHDYSDNERARAKRLCEAIVDARINKYNLGGKAWTRPVTDRTIVLVVGQVEEDASIEFGSPELKSNESLLRRVRKERPDAYIVYKPHPDVLAGLRKAGTDLTGGDMPYDEIVEDVDPSALLDSVDEVHTMTSLMGFEALMRGVPVTCHGLPFYAGWGLTDDRLVCERRGRARTIDELVHAALIDYPRYFSPRGRMFARPEDILVELADLARAGPARRSLPRRVLFWVVTRWVKLRGRK